MYSALQVGALNNDDDANTIRIDDTMMQMSRKLLQLDFFDE